MTKPLITIQHLINLQGPNIWTYRPVIEAWVDLSALAPEARTTASEPLAAILNWIPSLAQSFNNAEASRGLDAALARGELAPNLFEHVALTLQALANMPGGFGETQATSEPGLYKVIVRAWHPIVTTQALHCTAQLIEAALAGRHFNASQAVKALDDLRHKHCLGPSTSCIVDAADDRDIPAIRLNTGNLLQLGYGINQRRIWTAETDRTGAIA